MADDFNILRDHPNLKPYVLSEVQSTGTTIGHGYFGIVKEVVVPVCGAAKQIDSRHLDSPKITSRFAKELELMSTLRHPNILCSSWECTSFGTQIYLRLLWSGC